MRFLITLITTCLLALGAIGIINYHADPTGMIALARHETISDCSMFTDRRWTIPMTLTASDSRATMSGTSHMLHGFDEQDLEQYFGTSPVINSSLPAMTIDEMRWLLESVLASGKIRQALIGIEYAMFNSRFPGHPDALQDDVTHWRMVKNHFLPYFSLSATKASWYAWRQDCTQSLGKATGFPKAIPVQFLPKPNAQGDIHSSEQTARAHGSQHPFNEPAYRQSMASFEQLLAAGCSQKATLDIIIPPRHVRMERIAHELGLSAETRQWKHDVLAIVRKWQAQQCPVRLVDFQAYNTITTSPFQRPRDRTHGTKWYYEPSHFKPSTGRCILASLKGNAHACTKSPFGLELDENTIGLNEKRLLQQEQLRFRKSSAKPDQQ